MNEIGKRIQELRKKKGLSQEELAENAKVNLRTIQRIENNTNEPRGKTLHLICDALEVSIEEVVQYGKQIDNEYLMFFHLSVLSFLIIPLGNIIIPLIMWTHKKDSVLGLNKTGINLLNFQITWTVSIFLVFILLVISNHAFSIAINLLIILYVLNIFFPLYFVISYRNGNKDLKYPSFIKFIK